MLIETLLSHGFRPDGIAYLLNLIGEAFKGGKVRLDNFTSDNLKNQALLVSEATLSECLKSQQIGLMH